MDTDAQKALEDTVYDIRSLELTIRTEFTAWVTHLASSRMKGHDKPPIRTSFEGENCVMREWQALMQQIEVYNTHAAAKRDRGVECPSMTLADLIAQEEVKPVSTEHAISLMRRLVITSRIRLHAFGLTLRDQEDRMTRASVTLSKMVRSISESLEEGKADTRCDPWNLVRDMDCMTLALKATIAKVGMKMARQCIIPEFFDLVDGQRDDSVSTEGIRGIDEYLTQRKSRDAEIGSEQDEDGKPEPEEKDGEDSGVETDEGRDAESDESESEAYMEEEWQTCIKDYFPTLPKTS